MCGGTLTNEGKPLQMIDFVKLEFDDETEERLFEFCREHHLGLADSYQSPKDFKFHVTVMYSKATNPDFPEGERDFASQDLRPESFDMFGPENNLLALRVHRSEALLSLFDHYLSTYGHVSEFMPYRPHVTIRGCGADVAKRIKSFPLPDFDLRAVRLVHKVKLA